MISEKSCNIDYDKTIYKMRINLFKHIANTDSLKKYKFSNSNIKFIVNNDYDNYLIYKKKFINTIIKKFIINEKCINSSINLTEELKIIFDNEINYLISLDIHVNIKYYIYSNILNRLIFDILIRNENEPLFKKCNYPINKSLIENYDKFKEQDELNHLINLYKYYKNSSFIKNYINYFFFNDINNYNKINSKFYTTEDKHYLNFVLYYNEFFIGIYNNNFIIIKNDYYLQKIKNININYLNSISNLLLNNNNNIFKLKKYKLYKSLELFNNYLSDLINEIYIFNRDYLIYYNENNVNNTNYTNKKKILNIDVSNKKVNYISFRSKMINNTTNITNLLYYINKYTQKVNDTCTSDIMRKTYIIDLFNYLCMNPNIFCSSNYFSLCVLEKIIAFVLKHPKHKNILNLLLLNLGKYSCIFNRELPCIIDNNNNINHNINKYIKYHIYNYSKLNKINECIKNNNEYLYKINKLIETHNKYNYHPIFYTNEKKIFNNDLNENYIPVNYAIIQLIYMYYDEYIFTDKCGRDIYTYFLNIEDNCIYYLDLNVTNNFYDINKSNYLEINIKKSFKLSNMFSNIIKEYCNHKKINLCNYKYKTNEIMDHLSYRFNNFNKIIESEDKFQCLICFDDYNTVFRTKCNHNYCIECSVKWFIEKDENLCPYCKGNINNVDVEYSIYGYQHKHNKSTLDMITNGLNFII